MEESRSRPARSPRADAAANRERILAAAVRVIADEGVHAPVSRIAAAAGVGVATFYRGFPDRDALMQELERRAYAELNRILDDLRDEGAAGLPAVEAFLLRSLELGERLILPLHGAPPLVDDETRVSRQRIDQRLEEHLAAARAAGAVVSDANATDVIMCSALVTQPLQHGPDWVQSARRHVAVFVGGLTSGRPLPPPAIVQADLERSFRDRAAGQVR